MNRKEAIARLAHEANRALCLAYGDDSQPSWEDAPAWQKQSSVDGVSFQMDNPDAPVSATHDNWMRHKLEDGWEYGPVKDADQKLHPCLVSFESLPKEQQAKDYLFQAVVKACTAVD